MGRPCLAMPLQTCSSIPRTPARSAADARARARRRRRAGRAAADRRRAAAGGSGRCSVGVRWSPAPKTTATKRRTRCHASERRPASRTSMAAASARARRQAGRQRRGVVGDDDVAGPHQARQIVRAAMGDPAVVADDEQARSPPRGPLAAVTAPPSGGMLARDTVARTRASIRSAISTRPLPAASARAGSASGTASACIGVSMSPGSTATASMPRPTSSSRQMRDR